jgi:hypothetical protein
MADLESALLDAALGFARGRLNELLTVLATDAKSLLEAVLGTVPSAQQLTQLQAVEGEVDGHLSAARAHMTALTADLGAAPATVGEVSASFTEVAGAVTEVHDAIRSVATVVPEAGSADDALVAAIRRATAPLGGAFSGIVADLGLAGPGAQVADGFTATGTAIHYVLAHSEERTLAPPPAGATVALSASTFTGILDYGAAPATLALTLRTGLRVGLVADGLVKQILPVGDVAVNVTATVDTTHGLSLGAGSRNRVSLPGSLSVPGVDLRDLGLEIAPTSPPAFDITSVLAGPLGPMSAVVQGAGIRLFIDPAKLLAGQNAVQVQAKPPDGAGLRLDAGIVRGGGFLAHRTHPDGVQEYGGALDLRVGPVEITAVGLLTPDPFSLVLVLGVRFDPAIQLSFGFTVNAVGGLLALERTLSSDVLRDRLHDHTADTILFPTDPVGAAPTILDTLGAIFPQVPGGFVIGPMMELGWGSPVSFVTARLGVVISLPDPKVVLIGSLRVALPAPAAPIVDLRADLYGEITPDHLLFLVSLADSRLAGFSLSGDFGLLIGFGDDPEFALSAGGFHPHYTPPGELAGMRRVGVDMSPPALITMRADAYLALTSNSFQLGCRVELRAEVAGIGAEGHLSFDALVRWAPKFAFEIDLKAGVALFADGASFAGVDLSLHLEGPGPWLAHGTASISLLFFDIDFEVPPISWGSGDNLPPDPVSPQQLVRDKLSEPGAWEAQLPPDADGLLRLAPAPDGQLVVHPLGVLESRQKAVPLETVLDRIGPHPVTVRRVNLGVPTVGGLPAKAVSHAMELFAPGTFLNLTDSEKLSRPAFERFPAGIVLNGADTETFGTPVPTAYRWDTVFPNKQQPGRPDAVLFADHVQFAVLRSGPAGKFATQNRNPFMLSRPQIDYAGAGQVTVVTTRDLKPAAGATAAVMTTTAAARVVEDLVAADASLAGTLQFAAAGVGA